MGTIYQFDSLFYLMVDEISRTKSEIKRNKIKKRINVFIKVLEGGNARISVIFSFCTLYFFSTVYSKLGLTLTRAR